MNILRLDIENHQVVIYQYIDGKTVWQKSAQTIAELSFPRQAFSDLSGIYVYRGPGGYSKLRSLWAFALGLSLKKIPVQGYEKWHSNLSRTLPRNIDRSIVYAQEIK